MMTVLMVSAALLLTLDGETSQYSATEVVYRFVDSSVPPEYHRSYTITVNSDSVKVSVDCYGEILAEEAYPSSPTVLEGILDVFSDSGLSIGEERENEGCAGGTTELLSLYMDDQEVFNGRVYHCGGEDYGDLEGNISVMAEAMRELVPDLGTLLN